MYFYNFICQSLFLSYLLYVILKKLKIFKSFIDYLCKYVALYVYYCTVVLFYKNGIKSNKSNKKLI